MDTLRSQKRCESLIDKLDPVVSLDASNRKTKLRVSIGAKISDVGDDFRLVN